MSTNTEEAVFGPNLKVRCSICCETSGWRTNTEVDVWWKEHTRQTKHSVMAKFFRDNSKRGPR